MKHRLWTAALLTVLLISVTALADFVPNYISYEGTVLDEFGQPGAGKRSFTFLLYDSAHHMRWAEEHLDIPLNEQGAFQVLLGRSKPLPVIEPDWTFTMWLSANGSSWKTVIQTQTMTSVMYAMQADDVRSAPGDLIVKEDLQVDDTLTSSGAISVNYLTAADITAGSAGIRRLAVSELQGATGGLINVNSRLELTQDVMMKGSVSLMKVMDMTPALATNLSGRVYLLAIPFSSVDTTIKVTYAAGGDPVVYQCNMPNFNLFLPLDLHKGDRIQVYDGWGKEVPLNALNYFRTFKAVQMGQ
ncbi:MAG: hypothetical protein EOL87_13885 [Spartobacteria bacterium]|nr:hypothetical protein [Spartobacteria bacterium]